MDDIAMEPPHSPERRFVGAFLLGTAGLAVFDFWFPGLVMLLGACLLGYAAWTNNTVWAGRTGAVLLLASSVYALWRWLGRVAPDYVFPLIMIALAVGFLLRFDLPTDDG
jgi:hypothetical protein